MIQFIRTSYIYNGIVIRHYRTSKFSDAAQFSNKWGGNIKAVTIDGVTTYGIKISNQ